MTPITDNKPSPIDILFDKLLATSTQVEQLDAHMEFLTEVVDFATSRYDFYYGLSKPLIEKRNNNPDSLSEEEERELRRNLNLSVSCHEFSQKMLRTLDNYHVDFKKLKKKVEVLDDEVKKMGKQTTF